MKEDPRRNDEYRSKVVEELGFGPKSERTDMTAEDRAVVAEVLTTKAAAFWLDGTPRTVLRHLMHDTIPTGPPVRTPPHHLKGEEAQWVEEAQWLVLRLRQKNLLLLFPEFLHNSGI